MRHKLTLALVVVGSMMWGAHASAATCRDQSAQKKLAGAAQKSFLTKCEKNANVACELSASSKKLAGAAKASHIKKCLSDAVGK